jgi:hypothetical protein
MSPQVKADRIRYLSRPAGDTPSVESAVRSLATHRLKVSDHKSCELPFDGVSDIQNQLNIGIRITLITFGTLDAELSS